MLYPVALSRVEYDGGVRWQKHPTMVSWLVERREVGMQAT